MKKRAHRCERLQWKSEQKRHGKIIKKVFYVKSCVLRVKVLCDSRLHGSRRSRVALCEGRLSAICHIAPPSIGAVRLRSREGVAGDAVYG